MSGRTKKREPAPAESAPEGRPFHLLALTLAAFGVAAGPMITSEGLTFGGRLTLDFFLCLAAACGLLDAFLGRKRNGTLKIGLTGVELPALVFLVLTAISAAAAGDVHAAQLRVFQWGSYLSFAFLAFHLARRPMERRILLAALLASALVIAVHGLHQVFIDIPAGRSQFATAAGKILRSMGHENAMLPEMRGRLLKDRPFGTFVLPTMLAGFLALVIPAFVGQALDAWRKQRRRLTLLLNALLLAVLLWCLVLTGSKGGWLAFAAGATVMLTIVGRRWAKKRRRVMIPLVVLILAGAITLALLPFTPPASEYLSSFRTRVPYWSASVKMARSHPLLGVGAGGWAGFYSTLKAAGDQETRLAHNDYLQIAAEIGIPALLAYLWFWGMVFFRVRSRREPAAREDGEGPVERLYLITGLCGGTAAFLLQMVTVQTFHSMAGAFFWLWPLIIWFAWCALYLLFVDRRESGGTPLLRAGLAGGIVAMLAHGLVDFDFHLDGCAQTLLTMAALLLAVSLDGRPLPTVWRLPRTATVRAAGGVLVLAAICLLGTGYVVPVTRADALYQQARRGMLADSRMPLEEQLVLLGKAVELDPKSPVLHASLGEVQLALVRRTATPSPALRAVYAEGIGHLEKAMALRPQSYVYATKLAEMYQWVAAGAIGRRRRDLLERALDNFARARQRFPSSARLPFRMGSIHYALGRRDKARQLFETALELESQQYVARNELTNEQRRTILRAFPDLRDKARPPSHMRGS